MLFVLLIYSIHNNVLSNVCVRDFTPTLILCDVLTEPSHMVISVISVYCGVYQVLPVLRTVCPTHVSDSYCITQNGAPCMPNVFVEQFVDSNSLLNNNVSSVVKRCRMWDS